MTDHERFDDAEHPGPRLPLIALLVACALLGGTTLLVPRLVGPLPLLSLLAGGALLGLSFWIIAFAVELRRGPIWWIVATLALLVTGGALAGFGAFRITNADATADASTFAETQIGPDGAPQLPPRPDRGPISRRFVETIQADAAERRATGDRLAKIGVGALNSPHFLQQSPAILGDCAAIGTLAQAVDAAEAKRVERTAALVRAIDAAPLAPELRRGMKLMAAPLDGTGDSAATVDKAMFASAEALCVLLARRTWSNVGGEFAFRGAADTAAFKAIHARRMQAAGDATRLQRRAKARFEEGRELVRDALD